MVKTPQIEAIQGFAPLGLSDSVKVTRNDVAQIIRATFPSYKGRKITVKPKASIAIDSSGLNWSGGTRYQYRACTLEGQATGNLDRHNASAPWEKAPGSHSVEVLQGHVIVEHCMFCGKDLGLRIYVNPADMPKLLGRSQ